MNMDAGAVNYKKAEYFIGVIETVNWMMIKKVRCKSSSSRIK